jgi:hypothetical protein
VGLLAIAKAGTKESLKKRRISMSKLVISQDTIPVPLTVPADARDIFCQNYLKATCNSGRLFMFAGDQLQALHASDFLQPTSALSPVTQPTTTTFPTSLS